jgi:transcriptional regulator of acetoin/glycerol metabolism
MPQRSSDGSVNQTRMTHDRAILRHSSKEIRRISNTLGQCAGDVTAAARQLGMNLRTLQRRLKEYGLRDELQACRDASVHAERQRTINALLKHNGRISLAAEELRIAASTLQARIKRYEIGDISRLRPRKPTPTEERAMLTDSIRRNQGQMWRVGQELGMSHSTLKARVRKYGLFTEAQALRLEANLIGSRKNLSKMHFEKKKKELTVLLQSNGWNVRRTATAARVSVGTVYNMIRSLGIERSELESEDRLRRLIDGLRLGNGVLERAAKVMGVAPNTVSQWCIEFEISARDYRPK